jgi:DUF438 domain-containing protein
MDSTLLAAILDSLKEPILFADTNHMVLYMNRAAIAHYSKGDSVLGHSLLECHNETSEKLLNEVLAALQAGEEERLTIDDETRRIHMRAVRDTEGNLLGYYERYEPPSSDRSKQNN